MLDVHFGVPYEGLSFSTVSVMWNLSSVHNALTSVVVHSGLAFAATTTKKKSAILWQNCVLSCHKKQCVHLLCLLKLKNLLLIICKNLVSLFPRVLKLEAKSRRVKFIHERKHIYHNKETQSRLTADLFCS